MTDDPHSDPAESQSDDQSDNQSDDQSEHQPDSRQALEDQDESTFTPVRIIGFLLSLGVIFVALPMTSQTPGESLQTTTRVMLQEQLDPLKKAFDERGASSEDPEKIALAVDSDASLFSARDTEQDKAELAASLDALVHQELERVRSMRIVPAEQAAATLRVDLTREDDALGFEATLLDEEPETLAQTSKRLGHWESVLPPLIAVLIALFFRKLLVALVGAVWLGALLQTNFNPLTATWMTVDEYVVASVADTFNLYIIAFTFTLVGMVQVITRMGGMAGVLEAFRFLATSARSTRVATAFVGLAIFFDDYANTIVTGTTMRSLTDRMRISREKLAYIVDSTSAPIAGIAIISTWIGYEVGLFDTLSQQLGLGRSGYDIFFEIIPLRFYCILSLVFVFANGWLGRDYGPMLKAERRAIDTGDVLRPGSTPLTSKALSDIGPAEGIPHRWYNAFIPVTIVIVGVMLGMYWSGWRGGGAVEQIPGMSAALWGDSSVSTLFGAWGTALADAGSWTTWRDAFSNSDSAKVLFWASLLGSVAAIVLAISQKLLSARDAIFTWFKAIPAMWLAVAILVLAWSIQGVCSDLSTSVYLVGAIEGLISPAWLPLLTFLLAAVVAFATGTSWGTMGILLPAIIPLAFYMTGGEGIVLLLCFGAVLDGAIFGDHCSPISDTTVMSSIASAVDHIDHVRTQFPYAVTVMSAAAGFGYVGVAFGLPVWLALVLGAASLVTVLLTVGRSTADRRQDALQGSGQP
ncbi:MAG: Na+/H+ antiporter NhaC family protein [Myxococcota bacterium]